MHYKLCPYCGGRGRGCQFCGGTGTKHRRSRWSLRHAQ